MDEKNNLTLEDFGSEPDNDVPGEKEKKTPASDENNNDSIFGAEIQFDEQQTQEESTDGELIEYNESNTELNVLDETPTDAHNTAKKKKKPFLIMPCVIISLCILIAGIAAGISYLMFFDDSIDGTYLIENPDAEGQEIKNYYIFGDNDNNGENGGDLQLLVGSLKFNGSYKLINQDGKSQIQLDLQAVNLYGTYNYKVEGNKLTGINIEIYDDAGNSMKFIPSKYEKTEIEPIKNAKVDSKLVGTWTDKNGYGIEYTFNEDGTLLMSDGTMEITSYYSADKGKLNIKYQSDSVIENKAEYSFDSDTLTLNQMEFQKVVEESQ